MQQESDRNPDSSLPSAAGASSSSNSSGMMAGGPPSHLPTGPQAEAEESSLATPQQDSKTLSTAELGEETEASPSLGAAGDAKQRMIRTAEPLFALTDSKINEATLPFIDIIQSALGLEHILDPSNYAALLEELTPDLSTVLAALILLDIPRGCEFSLRHCSDFKEAKNLVRKHEFRYTTQHLLVFYADKATSQVMHAYRLDNQTLYATYSTSHLQAQGKQLAKTTPPEIHAEIKSYVISHDFQQQLAQLGIPQYNEQILYFILLWLKQQSATPLPPLGVTHYRRYRHLIKWLIQEANPNQAVAIEFRDDPRNPMRAGTMSPCQLALFLGRFDIVSWMKNKIELNGLHFEVTEGKATLLFVTSILQDRDLARQMETFLYDLGAEVCLFSCENVGVSTRINALSQQLIRSWLDTASSSSSSSPSPSPSNVTFASLRAQLPRTTILQTLSLTSLLQAEAPSALIQAILPEYRLANLNAIVTGISSIPAQDLLVHSPKPRLFSSLGDSHHHRSADHKDQKHHVSELHCSAFWHVLVHNQYDLARSMLLRVNVDVFHQCQRVQVPLPTQSRTSLSAAAAIHERIVYMNPVCLAVKTHSLPLLTFLVNEAKASITQTCYIEKLVAGRASATNQMQLRPTKLAMIECLYDIVKFLFTRRMATIAPTAVDREREDWIRLMLMHFPALPPVASSSPTSSSSSSSSSSALVTTTKPTSSPSMVEEKAESAARKQFEALKIIGLLLPETVLKTATTPPSKLKLGARMHNLWSGGGGNNSSRGASPSALSSSSAFSHPFEVLDYRNNPTLQAAQRLRITEQALGLTTEINIQDLLQIVLEYLANPEQAQHIKTQCIVM